MDAVKFVKEYLRICAEVDGCEECPVYKTDFCTIPANVLSQEIAEEVVRLVEEWSAAHPIKTRQDVFLEQWPEARIDDNGVLGVCPATVSLSYRKDGCGCINIHKTCPNCRNEFWTGAVK